jgi:orotate phosphoribosyltransferase
MQNMKNQFIALALQHGVLQWGQFTLKSGRQSPYFFNMGLFNQGDALKKVGEYYAETILNYKIPCLHLFGPAYKGIPLVTATAIALAEKNMTTKVTFNRKEIKDHGEGGKSIGAPLNDDILMIDDVITAGTAFREAKVLIEASGGHLSHILVALNRCERGQSEHSALYDIQQQDVKVYSIIDFFDLTHFLEQENQQDQLQLMQNYHQLYGTHQ